MNIGERVKKIRTEKRLSTYQLSEIVGVSQSAISKLENGKRKADGAILEKIATALNVSVERLTGESVSAIIKTRLEEIGMTIEQVADRARVSFSWLKNIDSFIPGDMEFMISAPEERELEWNDTIGAYKSYEWIGQVAEVIGLPPSLLRASLARQEIPTYDGPYPSWEEVRKSFQNDLENSENEPSELSDNSEKMDYLFTQLNEQGQDKALEHVELLTKISEYKAEITKVVMKLSKQGDLEEINENNIDNIGTDIKPTLDANSDSTNKIVPIIQKEEPEHLKVKAAQNDSAADPEQQRLMRQDF